MTRNQKKLLRAHRRAANTYWRQLAHGTLIVDDSKKNRIRVAMDNYERANYRLYLRQYLPNHSLFA